LIQYTIKQTDTVQSLLTNTPAPGTWCAAVPLWHNPFILQGPNTPWCLPPREGPFQLLNPHCLRLDTIGHLILLDLFVRGLPVRGELVTVQMVTRPFRGPRGQRGALQLPPPDLLADVPGLLDAIAEVRNTIPEGWYVAAAAAIFLDPAGEPLALSRMSENVVNCLLSSLTVPPKGPAPLSLFSASVRDTTRIFLREDRKEKEEKLNRFIARTFRTPAPPQGWNAKNVFHIFARTAPLSFSNTIKEPFWLLAYNGIDVPSRWGTAAARGPPCPCGAHGTVDLHHVFWDCPVVQEIRSLVERPLHTLNLLPPGIRLPIWSVWLCRRPGPLAQWVWDTMCFISLYAMDQGRRELARTSTLSPSVRTHMAVRRARQAFWRPPPLDLASRTPPRCGVAS
jgi:hypothetical protein